MASPEQPDSVSETAQQVQELFDSPELAQAMESDEFRHFLDHIPIAIAVSKILRGEQRIFYANPAFEALIGRRLTEFAGQGWSLLAGFRHESEPGLALPKAILSGEDHLGTFQREAPEPPTGDTAATPAPAPMIVDAYAGIIQNDDGGEKYRIAALIDVTGRERAEREEYARQIHDKDTLLREIQHRVKNNLQLITALIRIEARGQQRGDKVNLDRLAGRIESLYLLYQALAPEGFGNDLDLGHYVGQIASAVMDTYGVDGIRLDLKVDHAPLSINIAMPIGLIVNELITNAFKYAFAGRDHGVISVACLHEGERYRVAVADDGAGLPEGVTWPMPGKIGALILQSLRENADADIAVESAPGKGARVTISFGPKTPAE